MQAEVRALKAFDWREDAACKEPGCDPAWWFPEKGGRHTNTARARAICKSCPVRFPCLTYGTQFSEQGIWGGLSEDQRREFRKIIKHRRPLICQQCRDEFFVPAEAIGHPHMYCSDRCRHRASQDRKGRA